MTVCTVACCVMHSLKGSLHHHHHHHHHHQLLVSIDPQLSYCLQFLNTQPSWAPNVGWRRRPLPFPDQVTICRLRAAASLYSCRKDVAATAARLTDSQGTVWSVYTALVQNGLHRAQQVDHSGATATSCVLRERTDARATVPTVPLSSLSGSRPCSSTVLPTTEPENMTKP
jgi:hypothetical protein